MERAPDGLLRDRGLDVVDLAVLELEEALAHVGVRRAAHVALVEQRAVPHAEDGGGDRLAEGDVAVEAARARSRPGREDSASPRDHGDSLGMVKTAAAPWRVDRQTSHGDSLGGGLTPTAPQARGCARACAPARGSPNQRAVSSPRCARMSPPRETSLGGRTTPPQVAGGSPKPRGARPALRSGVSAEGGACLPGVEPPPTTAPLNAISRDFAATRFHAISLRRDFTRFRRRLVRRLPPHL